MQLHWNPVLSFMYYVYSVVNYNVLFFFFGTQNISLRGCAALTRIYIPIMGIIVVVYSIQIIFVLKFP